MAAIDALLKKLVEANGSDLHLTANNKPQIRVCGDMGIMEDQNPIPAAKMKELLMEIAPKRNWEEFSRTGDTDFAYEIKDLCRFRVNFFMDHRGMGMVSRVIPSKILTLEELNLPNVCRDFCMLTKGLVVVTGPTGSGKSTTLAAMMDYVNKVRHDHVITVEDPIEFIYPSINGLINQREVGRHTKSFKIALRAALR